MKVAMPSLLYIAISQVLGLRAVAIAQGFSKEGQIHTNFVDLRG